MSIKHRHFQICTTCMLSSQMSGMLAAECYTLSALQEVHKANEEKDLACKLLYSDVADLKGALKAAQEANTGMSEVPCEYLVCIAIVRHSGCPPIDAVHLGHLFDHGAWLDRCECL